MKTLAEKAPDQNIQKEISSSTSKKMVSKHKNCIQNDEWRKEAKTRLDLELFEMRLLDFGSCG
jgi:hypothetical protein